MKKRTKRMLALFLLINIVIGACAYYSVLFDKARAMMSVYNYDIDKSMRLIEEEKERWKYLIEDYDETYPSIDSNVKAYVENPAKMLAVLKRKGLTGEDRNILEYGSLKINMSQNIVEVNGEIKKIPKKQYEILMYLIENQGIILTREQILERAWSDEYAVYDRVVDTHIKKLSALLEDEGSRIETVVGVGYMWK